MNDYFDGQSDEEDIPCDCGSCPECSYRTRHVSPGSEFDEFDDYADYIYPDSTFRQHALDKGDTNE